jgi:hypothetical protein
VISVHYAVVLGIAGEPCAGVGAPSRRGLEAPWHDRLRKRIATDQRSETGEFRAAEHHES